MAKKNNDVQINVNVNANKAETGLKKVIKSISSLGDSSKKQGSSISSSFISAEKNLKSFDGSVTTLSKGISGLAGSIAGLAGAYGLGAIAKSSLESITELKRLADTAGESYTSFQKLSYAASQYGISQDDVSEAIHEAKMRIAEFIDDGAGPATEILKKMGYTGAEGIKKLKEETEDFSTFFTEFINKNQGLSSKTQLFNFDEMFGGEAAEKLQKLVTINGNVTDAFKIFAAEAEKTGVILDANLIEKADKVNNRLGVLSDVITAQFTTAIAQASPEILNLTNKMIDWIGTNHQAIQLHFEKIINGITQAFIGLAGAINNADINMQGFVLAKEGLISWKDYLTKSTNEIKEQIKTVTFDAELKDLNERFLNNINDLALTKDKIKSNNKTGIYTDEEINEFKKDIVRLENYNTLFTAEIAKLNAKKAEALKPTKTTTDTNTSNNTNTKEEETAAEYEKRLEAQRKQYEATIATLRQQREDQANKAARNKAEQELKAAQAKYDKLQSDAKTHAENMSTIHEALGVRLLELQKNYQAAEIKDTNDFYNEKQTELTEDLTSLEAAKKAALLKGETETSNAIIAKITETNATIRQLNEVRAQEIIAINKQYNDESINKINSLNINTRLLNAENTDGTTNIKAKYDALFDQLNQEYAQDMEAWGTNEAGKAAQTELYTAKIRELNIQKHEEEKQNLTGLAAYYETISDQIKESEKNMSADIAGNITDGMTNALSSFADGSKTAKDAFKDMATSILKDIANMIIKMTILQAVQSGMQAMGYSDGGAFSGGNPVASAKGNVFNHGNVTAFATGGIVDSPHIFPMANGGIGLMGEAGPEAIMPLTRLSNGKLGVNANVGGSNNSSSGINISVVNNFDGGDMGSEEDQNRMAKKIKESIIEVYKQEQAKDMRVGGSLYNYNRGM